MTNPVLIAFTSFLSGTLFQLFDRDILNMIDAIKSYAGKSPYISRKVSVYIRGLKFG